EADGQSDGALLDGVGAEVRPDGALFDDREVHRQRAGAQRNGQSVSALDGKTARDCGAAPVNRLVDIGRGEDLAVENDGEGLVDVLARQPGKALSALRIERD